MSGLWCVNVGYGQQALVDAATRQMQELPFYNAFFQTATPPAIELAELLAEVTPPQFQHVFFSGSGSEGNDTVVRMVRRYWDILGQPQRQVIISRHNAYHGSTMAGASLGGMSGMHAQGGLPIPGIVHIEQPYWWEHGREMSATTSAWLAAGWLEEKILEVGPDKVAAFIGEPVQGAGGVIIPPATYWPEIQRICDKYGILLVSDEVICGFGRTGNWFGCETMGSQARPDDLRQGRDQRLRAAGRRDGRRPRGQGADRAGRRVQPRLHLFGPPGGLRGGAGQHQADPASRGWWSMCATTWARILLQPSPAGRAPAGG
jgi:putrescine aminotransferase